MSRRYKEPTTVTLGRGLYGLQPVAFTWRGRTYAVEVIGSWKLQDRWWDRARHADRVYWRVMTKVLGVYELYCENGHDWRLDTVQD
jgi:hypothetical protein